MDLSQFFVRDKDPTMWYTFLRGPLHSRAGFNWWEAWGPVYSGGTGRLQQLYD